MKIELATINSTPVFITYHSSSQFERICGATHDKRGGRWLFPAFPPFIENVLHDLVKVYKDLSFSEEAQQWISSMKTRDEWLTEVSGLTLPVPSFNHQLDGLADVLHNYRWILDWEMGTGKTKVMIDTIKYLQCKALILCPLIALSTWKTEADLHSGKTLKVLLLEASSRDKKVNLIQQSPEYDILVTTFDTARIHGTPTLFPQTIKAFKQSGRVPHHKLQLILKRLNNPTLQKQLAVEWINGRPPRKLHESVTDIVGDQPQWIGEFPYTMIVADESHRCKDIKSGRTKMLMHLAKTAARRVLLTGTLSDGDPRNLYPQLKTLAPYLILDDWKAFCSRHLITAPFNKHMVVGFRNLHIINRKIDFISSKRTLDECVDMPERRFEVIRYELSPAQRRNYNYVVDEWCVERPNAEPLELQNGAIRVMKLLQICSGFVYVPVDTGMCDTCPQLRQCVLDSIQPGAKKCINRDQVERESLHYPVNPKLAILIDKLTDLLSAHKVIVWAHYTQELDDIEKELKKNKWGYVRVDGKTTKYIKELGSKFNTVDSCRVYLSQISTGISVTLNAAKYVFNYSRSWSMEQRKQSLGRNYRIGQDKKVIVYDLCGERTLELQQLTALQNKEEIAQILTTKINCALCRKYATCLNNNIEPWTKNCVLKTQAPRVIARARTI